MEIRRKRRGSRGINDDGLEVVVLPENRRYNRRYWYLLLKWGWDIDDGPRYPNADKKLVTGNALAALRRERKWV